MTFDRYRMTNYFSQKFHQIILSLMINFAFHFTELHMRTVLMY
ncbi:hypothetical protein T4E_12377 [Trichinella pseudospiralis]|uniref:Uncharacterized protein n=1 Tax=Trichinella pseudospiralis TaxID=6337 RepID=A0A0V0WHW9_TRIPS|nr:hypothetical protein T4E_12377 [Trichinella pseudospiralis]